MNRLNRPMIHFFHPGSWINDPNGLVFADDLYHLFYQLNPDSTQWDNIHWGHASSRDAVHWSVTRPALLPDGATGLPFSGSAVSVAQSESGQEPYGLLAMYTRSLPQTDGSLQEQYLGRFDASTEVFEPVVQEPIIPNPGLKDFRDPKLWWDTDGWHAVIAAGDHLRFYRSDDLISWTETSTFSDDIGRSNGVWECPDLIRFATEEGASVDVLIVSVAVHDSAESSNVIYYLGNFDGEQFTPLPGTGYRPVDYGKDFYAVQSWSGLSLDTPLVTGWLGNWAYSHDLRGDEYSGCLSIPRRLELQREGSIWRLIQNPVPATESLYGERATPSQEEAGRTEWRLPPRAPFLLHGTWEPEPGEVLEIAIADHTGKRFRATFSDEQHLVRVLLDRRELWEPSNDQDGLTRFSVEKRREEPGMDIRVFVDTCCVELFLDGGRAVATELVPWDDGERRIAIGGSSPNQGGVTWELIRLIPMRIV